MSKIALSGDASGTGTFTIASPNSNSNYTLTLPTNSGTVLTSAAQNIPTAALPVQLSINSGAPAGSLAIDSSGRMTTPNRPAFKAFQGSTFTYSGGTGPAKITALDTKQFDTGNNYNTSTQRFVAPVSGLYFFFGQIYYGSGSDGYYGAGIYVNGSQQNAFIYFRGGFGDVSACVSNIQYINANDYVEMYYYSVASVTRTSTNATYFSGYLLG